MGISHIVFTDSNGDRLEAVTRDLSAFGNPDTSPSFSIVNLGMAHTVHMNEEEIDHVMKTLGGLYGYEVRKINQIPEKKISRHVHRNGMIEPGIDDYPIHLLPEGDQVRRGFTNGTLKRATFESNAGYSVVYQESSDV